MCHFFCDYSVVATGREIAESSSPRDAAGTGATRTSRPGSPRSRRSPFQPFRSTAMPMASIQARRITDPNSRVDTITGCSPERVTTFLRNDPRNGRPPCWRRRSWRASRARSTRKVGERAGDLGIGLDGSQKGGSRFKPSRRRSAASAPWSTASTRRPVMHSILWQSSDISLCLRISPSLPA